ncbi:MAG TPA: toxin TcdB middle/N-terminal domain-containing protein, partial [Flavobacterium sp.]|nr:toxin TcdB middle/N-terminal domain-containing protein [Flavobacterium sp.]
LNNIKFYYDNMPLAAQGGENANLSGVQIFNIKSIYYTGKDGNDGGYSIVFEKESSILRKDLLINAKQGAKQAEPYRLSKIKIFDNIGYSNTAYFRSYKFFYTDGEFDKSLLAKFWVAENEHYYNTYSFEYHNELKSGSTALPTFGPDTSISTFQADSSLFSLPSGLNPAKINSTYTKEEGSTIRLSALLDFVTFSQNPYGHIILYSMINSASRAQAKGAQQLLDFNGDGVPDILYKNSSGLYIRPGIIDSGVVTGFGAETKVKNLQSNFAYTDTKTKSRGRDFGGSVSFLGWSIFANTSNITTSSKSTTPTYLIDANSDGLMDVVDGKDVWFNKSENGTPAFTKFSASTENMVIKANPVAPETAAVLPKDDVVKFWIAPRDGYIRFYDKISIENVNGANAIYSVEVPYFDGLTHPKPKRIYLTKLTAGMPSQSINIQRYNDYFSQIKGMPPLNQYDHLGVNSSNRLFVKSGDKIYIRLHQNEDDNFKVNSNPLIVYVDNAGKDLTNNALYDQDGFRVNNRDYSANFILNNHEAGMKLSHAGSITVNVPAVNFNVLNDDIKIRFIVQNLVTNQANEIYSQSYAQSASGLSIPAFSLNATISDPSVLMCLVESVSHVAYKDTGLNDITVNYATGGNSYMLNLVPKYNSYYVTDHKPKINLSNLGTSVPVLYPSGIKTYGVQLNKNISLVPFNNRPDCSFIYVVKIAGQAVGKRKVFITHINNIVSIHELDMATNQVISGIQPISLYTKDLTSSIIPKGQEFSIQVYCENNNDKEAYNIYRLLLAQKAFNIYYDNDAVLASVAETSVNAALLNPISKIYKNWGQFLFRDGFTDDNGLWDEYGALIQLQEPDTSINTANCNQLSNPQEMQACIAQNSSVTPPSNIFPLTTYKIGTVEKWKGASPEQYSSDTAFKDDEFATGVFNTSPFDIDLANSEDTSNIPPNSEMTRMKAADKIYLSSSKTKNYSGGASGNLGNISGGGNLGYSESSLTDPGSILIQDFTDLNGDGYPDFLSKEKIQMTFPTGGHKQQQGAYINDFVSISDNYQNAITLGANFNVKAFKTTGSNAKTGADRATTSQADNSAAWSPGVGVNSSYNFDSKDYGKAYWMDINGDGLIDRVSNASSSGFSCSLNYGNGMFGASSFYNSSTYASRPVGSAGISFGGSLSGLINSAAALAGNFGLEIGAGTSKSAGNPEKVFEDVNGDGLTDILSVNSSELNVNYNLGNKFSGQPAVLKKDAGTQNINFTEDITNLNGYATIGGHVYIPIGPIPILPVPPLFLFNIYIKVGIDASANIGMTISEVKKSFKDMNGDGYNDLVRDEGGNLIVNYSRIGKTNKLKQVTNEDSKSTFAIDYKHTKPDYSDPNARLVMSEVRIFNPDAFSPTYTASTADKDIVTRFKYENSRYDRRERTFLGFEKVTTEEFGSGNAVYRKNATNFYNKSYHTAGLVKTSELLSAADVVVSRNRNEYTLYKFNSSNTQLVAVGANEFESFDAGGQEGRRMAVVLPARTISTQFEPGGSVETIVQMSYNELGQLKNYSYTSPTSAYNSEITYHTGLGSNIIGVPKSIDVYSGTAAGGTLLRHRETTVNSNGDINQIKVKLNNSEFAITDLTYNSYGNLATIKYPANDSYARYQIDYQYDPLYNKYAVQTTNIFQETSSAEYDSRFDLPTKTTDIAGNSIEYTYDNIGRLAKVVGPRENALPPTFNYGKYTILFSYNIVPKTPGSLIGIYRANTLHYNEDTPENPVETIAFSDGFGKAIQTKKDIEHLGVERMSVSGITEYDLFGRPVKQYHPGTENKAASSTNMLNANNYLVLASQQPYASTTAYDIKDRIIQSVTEDNVVANTAYDIENGLYKTTATIPSVSQQSQTLANAEGKTVRSTNYFNGPVSTSFRYNAIGELVEVKDPEDISTLYAYDLAGRVLSVENPNRGTISYKYDPSGN